MVPGAGTVNAIKSRAASLFAEAQIETSPLISRRASPKWAVFGLAVGLDRSGVRNPLSKKDRNLRLGNKNKAIIAETFIGWLYLLTVQYWTHDNW